MIKSFGNKVAQAVFDGENTKESRRLDPNLHTIARRKLDWVNAAKSLLDLRLPPGNRLEALVGDKKGYHSIRINDQWRIVFRWVNSDAEDVTIEDYH